MRHVPLHWVRQGAGCGEIERKHRVGLRSDGAQTCWLFRLARLSCCTQSLEPTSDTYAHVRYNKCSRAQVYHKDSGKRHQDAAISLACILGQTVRASILSPVVFVRSAKFVCAPQETTCRAPHGRGAGMWLSMCRTPCGCGAGMGFPMERSPHTHRALSAKSVTGHRRECSSHRRHKRRRPEWAMLADPA